MYGEVETQFLLFGLLLHTQPLNSSEQHTRADLEFSSDFDIVKGEEHVLYLSMLWIKKVQNPSYFEKQVEKSRQQLR